MEAKYRKSKNFVSIEAKGYQTVKFKIRRDEFAIIKPLVGDDLPELLYCGKILPGEDGYVRNLDLSNQSLEKLTSNIGSFKHLNKLDVSNNQLKELPKEVWTLLLRHLDISNNNFEKLPEDITLGLVTYFNASNNQFKKIPDSIRWCSAMEVMDISDNQLKKLPRMGRTMHSLKTLYAANNQISELDSEELWETFELRDLYLSNNQIKDLPEWMKEYSRFDNLYFKGNPLSQKAMDILNSFSPAVHVEY